MTLRARPAIEVMPYLTQQLARHEDRVEGAECMALARAARAAGALLSPDDVRAMLLRERTSPGCAQRSRARRRMAARRRWWMGLKRTLFHRRLRRMRWPTDEDISRV